MVVLPDTTGHCLGIRETWDGVSFAVPAENHRSIPVADTKLLLRHLVALGRPGHRDPRTPYGAHL